MAEIYRKHIKCIWIIDYCDAQLSSGPLAEKATASYVKVLMLKELKSKPDVMADAYSQAISNIPESYEYYRQKLLEIKPMCHS